MDIFVEISNNISTITIILGIALTVFSIFLAMYFYYRPQRIKNPHCAIRNINLIRDLVGKFGDLEIHYMGYTIENFTATKIAFWNSGKETINDVDIAPANPLEIFVNEGFEILDAKILYVKNPVNQFRIELSEKRDYLKLLFDYLDQNEGAVIQILHTGKYPENIGVRGSIKGVKRLDCTSPSDSFAEHLIEKIPLPSNKIKARKIMGIALIIMPIILIALTLLAPGSSTHATSCVEVTIDGNQGLFCIPKTDSLGISSIAIVTMFIIAIPYWLFAYLFLKRRIPKGFDIFEEDI